MSDMDVKAVASAFSKRLAAHRIPDESILNLAKQVAAGGTRPVDINICQYGICIDYWIPRKGLSELLAKFEADRTLGGIKVFPKGIIDPDAFLVTVEHVMQR